MHGPRFANLVSMSLASVTEYLNKREQCALSKYRLSLSTGMEVACVTSPLKTYLKKKVIKTYNTNIQKVAMVKAVDVMGKLFG